MLQCEIIGNIGNDAEIKDFGGKKYVSFNVAHSERKKDANGFTQITTWISVLWYGERRRNIPIPEERLQGVCPGSFVCKDLSGQGRNYTSRNKCERQRSCPMRHERRPTGK